MTARDRYCAACDPFFARRRELFHTYEAPGCKHAGPGIQPRPWTEKERRDHAYVEAVAFRLEYPTDVAFYEAIHAASEGTQQ